jgi:hypothetical protein
MQNVEHHHHHQKAHSNLPGPPEKHSAHASMDGSDEHHARLALLRESRYVAPDRSAAKAKLPHEIVRRLYYIDQLNDRHLRGHHHTFACGPTSLTMALADHCAINPNTGKPTVHQPPTEQDRIGIITATGTMAAGEWVGGPTRMAVFAKHFGLNAQAYSSNNLDILTRCLEEGKGAVVDGHCLRSGHAHYVYVAGKDSNGYIMGDPASPKVTHWSAAHLRAFMTGYGFTAVWNDHAAPGARFVADAGGPGDLPAPAVPRQRSRDIVSNRDSGNNGSLFRTARLSEGQRATSQGDPGAKTAMVIPTALVDSGNNRNPAEPIPQNISFTPPRAPAPARINASIPRAFAPPPRERYVGDSQNDQSPDDAPFDEFLPLQGSIDGIVNHLAGGDGLTNLTFDDNSGCLSIGMRSWSQEGDLPELIKAWNQECPEQFQRIFGDDGNDLLDQTWLRDHNFREDPQLVEKFQQALSCPAMQDTQVQLTRSFINQAVNLGYQTGFRSDSSYAAIADACNRSGFGAVVRALQSSELKTAVSQRHEDQAIALMGTQLVCAKRQA